MAHYIQYDTITLKETHSSSTENTYMTRWNPHLLGSIMDSIINKPLNSA